MDPIFRMLQHSTSHARFLLHAVEQNEFYPDAANNGLSQEVEPECERSPTFHQIQEQNKEAFAKQGLIPQYWEHSDAPKDISPWDKPHAIVPLGSGLHVAHNGSSSRDCQGLDIIRPKLFQSQRPSSDDVFVLVPQFLDGDNCPLPVIDDPDSTSPPASPVSQKQPIDLTTSPSSPSSKILEEYTAATHLAVQLHLTAIQAAAENIPAWHKLIGTPTRRRAQLHRWFGLYTTWENEAAFTEQDRETWRKDLVLLTNDHNLYTKRAPVSKGGVHGVRGTPVGGKMRIGISARIMKKRATWFA